MKRRILVVEDEEKLRRVIELQLISAGFDVDKAGTAEEGLKLVDRADLVLTDLKLPNMDGLELLGLIRRQNAQVPVIMMTAFGSVETAVEAMKAGATDFLLKPFSLDHLMQVVNKALEVRALRDENRALKEELGRRYEFDNIIGRSPPMQEIFATIERVAPTRATVLLAGESGVGKDLIARAIHFHSPRRDRPLVKINCTAIPENLMESELFGYEKGAFTGAQTTKPGKFEQADTGTVFLDEIGDVPAAIQVKLLRILQEREFERLGSNETRHIDVRVIAATNQDLRAALEQGTFREDLYYRLNVVPLNIPPLRERKEDIPFLANHFVKKLAPDTGCRAESITDAAIEKLMAYHWPGNVRELENVIERSLVMCTGHRAGRRRYPAGERPAPPRAQRFALPAGRHDAGPIRAGPHPRGAAPRRRQQEPGRAPAGADAQRPALPADADGAGGVGWEHGHPANAASHGRARLDRRFRQERLRRAGGGWQSHHSSGCPGPLRLRRRRWTAQGRPGGRRGWRRRRWAPCRAALRSTRNHPRRDSLHSLRRPAQNVRRFRRRVPAGRGDGGVAKAAPDRSSKARRGVGNYNT